MITRILKDFSTIHDLMNYAQKILCIKRAWFLNENLIEIEAIIVKRIRDDECEWNRSSTSDENLKITRLISKYLLPIINIALFARLANYHSIPATGLLENLYHRSEAATGIDRYNRNSLTEQQSALKRFRWSRDEPQFGLRRRAGRGGKKTVEGRVPSGWAYVTVHAITINRVNSTRRPRARARWNAWRRKGKGKERKGRRAR